MVTACPVCSSEQVYQIMNIPNVPVHCNRLWPTREEALTAPRGDIELTYCTRCTHVFNASFDPKLVEYSPGYENSLHFSPRFQEYAQTLAKRLVNTYNLFGKKVVEIGCGRGEFLAILCNLGQNKGIGFDPSAPQGSPFEGHNTDISIIKDFYSEAYSWLEPDFVCCRHVLEHVKSPVEFVRSIQRTAGQVSDTTLFFEVPNAMFTLKKLGIWDLIYEHCGYFTQESLQFLFNSLSCRILHTQSEYMDQFLCLEAESQYSGKSILTPDEVSSSATVWSYVQDFAYRYQELIEKWMSFFNQTISPKAKVAVWGAGSKGVSFLNFLNLTDQIAYLVDINPAKHGMYVPGTGQHVIGPAQLVEEEPDAIMVMNPVYEYEIREIIKTVGLSPELHLVC